MNAKPKLKEAKMNASRLQSVIKSLEAATCGRAYCQPLDSCASYIGWLAQYKKLPENQIHFLAEWATSLFCGDYDFLDYLETDAGRLELEAIKKIKAL